MNMSSPPRDYYHPILSMGVGSCWSCLPTPSGPGVGATRAKSHDALLRTADHIADNLIKYFDNLFWAHPDVDCPVLHTRITERLIARLNAGQNEAGKMRLEFGPSPEDDDSSCSSDDSSPDITPPSGHTVVALITTPKQPYNPDSTVAAGAPPRFQSPPPPPPPPSPDDPARSSSPESETDSGAASPSEDSDEDEKGVFADGISEQGKQDCSQKIVSNIEKPEALNALLA